MIERATWPPSAQPSEDEFVSFALLREKGPDVGFPASRAWGTEASRYGISVRRATIAMLGAFGRCQR